VQKLSLDVMALTEISGHCSLSAHLCLSVRSFEQLYFARCGSAENSDARAIYMA